MATKKKAAGATKKKAGPPRRKTPRKAAPKSHGLEVRASAEVDRDSPALSPLIERIEREGGVVTGAYRDPLGGHATLLAVLPIDRVEPTPFQRDLSEAHHKRLATVIEKTGRFLDPIIVVTAPKEGFWTPNGRHRLEAMRRLGAKAITALVVPEREIAWQILALNTEKAHNLKERALEVIRIYRGLLEEDASRPESTFTFYLEDPALVTLGICYERDARFAGGAYHPVLRRTMHFSDEPLDVAIEEHERLADRTMALEAAVSAAVAKLKERGLTSPYLRAFVVARINPLRFMKGEPPPAEELLATMTARAQRFDAGRVTQNDLAKMGGAPPEE
jgi:ParB family chromosome partitioning protein